MKTNTMDKGKRRPGNPGTLRVKIRRVQHSVSVRPDILNAFKKKFGRGWNRKVEDYMVSEIKEVS